jgi:hypothetical protein
MANFSGAGGYIPMFAILGTIATFPVTLLLWKGVAAGEEAEDGKMDYAKLKRNLATILLPAYILSLLFWLSFVRSEVSRYGGSLVGFSVYAALIAGIHMFGMYFSIYRPAKRQSEEGILTRGKWFASTFMLAILMSIIGYFASVSLLILGE